MADKDDRDWREWAARFDERTLNNYHLMQKIEEHQRVSNGIVGGCVERSIHNGTRIGMLIWGLGVTLPIAVAVVLTKLQGWW